MAALPALSINLERLPDHARGYCVIEVACEADRQQLRHPSGMELIWVVNPACKQPNTQLVDRVRGLAWLPDTPYPWFAGEFDAMRAMRGFCRDEKQLDKRRMYLSSYWKSGDTDEGMKRAKRLDGGA